MSSPPIDGVESVEVESWWAIALYPEMDAPGLVTAFAIGHVRHGRRAPPRRSSSTASCPMSTIRTP